MAKRPHSNQGSNGSSKRPFSLSNIMAASSATTKSALSMVNVLHASPASSHGPVIKCENSCAPDTAIANFLDELRDTIESRGMGGSIEVEVRLGEITSSSQQIRFRPSIPGLDAAISLSDARMREMDAKFVSGVKEQAYAKYAKAAGRMAEGDKFAKRQEKQTVYSFPGSKRVIEEIDPYTDQKQAPYMQVKERLGCINIFLPNCPYDVRVAVSCEFPNQELPNGLEDMNGAEKERHKERTSVVGRDLQIDLTEVLDGIGGQKLYEVEVELKNNAVQDWLRIGDDAQSLKAASENAAQLWNIVRFFMPSAGQAFKKQWGFEGDEAIRNAYTSIFADNWNSDKFPGTMPVGFARRHIKTIKEKRYWVAEKTDGVRYFLVVAGGTVALIDRTNSPFTCGGLELLSTVLPEGTVLDGEFVQHQREKKYIFMAFDIMATGLYPSTHHANKTFEQRLNILNDFLSESGPYYSALQGHVQASSVLSIVRKRWLPSTHITQVFRHIQKVKLPDNTISRIYADGKREHFTDGIVFCPDTPYQCGSHNYYLKWKWSDLITIDFVAKLSQDGQISLSCGGPHNSNIDLDRLVMIDPKDNSAIRKVLQHQSNHSAVLEFAFSTESGLWNYKLHRPDKDRANYIHTVLGSLLNIAESISEEELQYRLIHSSDNWNEQMKHSRQKILAGSRR